MTTANLMKISSMNGTFSSQVGRSQKMQNENNENLEVAEAFAGLMNQANQALNQMVDDAGSVMTSKGVRVDDVQSAAESYERYSYKDNSIESAPVDDPSVEEQMAEAAEVFEQTENDVMDAISEAYGVNEEEIQQLLDDMGLSVLDLLDPANLVNFIMQLTGAVSSEELLLDTNFLQIMSTMDALAEGLMKDLNVDENGLQNLINQMELLTEETRIPEEMKDGIDNLVEKTVVDEIVTDETAQVVDTVNQQTEAEGNKQGIAGTAEEVETVEDEVVVQVEKKGTASETTGTMETESNETMVNKLTEGQDAQNLNQNAGEQSLLNQNSNSENLVMTQANAAMNTTADVAQTQFTSYFSADSVQIMEQIVQQMKVTISAETTSMEMQLNPENLGKVYVSISSEEGVINAQFRATNEIVKEALETQIATLRENLNQAGVKVDAVEVTIASHEFERNLEQNHQNPEEAAEAKENQTGKRRNLSIDSLDELSGVMTEEESLVAQLMRDNGNSVDFTA